jgi:hypothetical protein
LLDIIVPIPICNVELAPDALTAIAQHTDVPFRVIVMVDGGVRKDFEQLEAFLAGFESSWKLMHNSPEVGLNQTLREALEECTQKLTAVIAPEVRLLDSQWFGKVQVVFHRDPICGIADTWPNTKSATLHPVRRAHNNPTSDGCRFAVLQTAFAKKTPPYGAVDPMTFWSRYCMAHGGSSWAVPSVRYTEAEHSLHELGRVTVGKRG